MDRRVTAQFHAVYFAGGEIDLVEAVRRVEALDLPSRERTLGNGIKLRLEDASYENGMVLAELTRVQSENLPTEVTPTGIGPLPLPEIGHASSLLYDPVSRVMVLHFAPFMTASRVCEYLSAFSGSTVYAPYPVINQATLTQLRDETPTKIRIKVAHATQFSDDPNPHGSVRGNFASMARALNGHVIDVSISVGHSSEPLHKPSVLSTITSALGWTDVDVKSIKVSTEESEIPYDFVRQLLKMPDELELFDRDPIRSRAVRYNHLRHAFETQRIYLRANYGPRRSQ